MKMNDFSHMRQVLKNWNLELTEEKEKKFQMFYDMLVEKNKVMNLTAITEFDEVVEKHFLDNLSLIQVLDLNRSMKVLDLGTGAGFPGIPLKIMFPNLRITLMDSLNKRILFLDEVIEALGLNEVETVHARAEELARDKNYRESYDLCVSRAVANLSTLSEYCLPFISIGGKFIPYKSGEVEEEVNQAKKAIFLLGGKIKDVVKFDLPDSDIHRSFVLIDKEKGTPKAYPRKAGTPSKSPL
ncbi:MAG: 16S rRNA (guanine(527)-N(7))-methyltransferase RsmG [Roseburia sp.]